MRWFRCIATARVGARRLRTHSRTHGRCRTAQGHRRGSAVRVAAAGLRTHCQNRRGVTDRCARCSRGRRRHRVAGACAHRARRRRHAIRAALSRGPPGSPRRGLCPSSRDGGAEGRPARHAALAAGSEEQPGLRQRICMTAYCQLILSSFIRLPLRIATLSASLRNGALSTRSTVTGQLNGTSVP